MTWCILDGCYVIRPDVALTLALGSTVGRVIPHRSPVKAKVDACVLADSSDLLASLNHYVLAQVGQPVTKGVVLKETAAEILDVPYNSCSPLRRLGLDSAWFPELWLDVSADAVFLAHWNEELLSSPVEAALGVNRNLPQSRGSLHSQVEVLGSEVS